MGLVKNMVMVDGIDGAGKGVIVDMLGEISTGRGHRILDVRKHHQQHDAHPGPELLAAHTVLLTAEPTFTGIGRRIRTSSIRNGTRLSPMEIAREYSEDRHDLYKQVILRHGSYIFQERGVVTSLAYQPAHARFNRLPEPTLEQVMALPGNAFCLMHPPEFLIIAQISPETAARRLKARKKDDDAVFEELRFQQALIEVYDGIELREIFEQRGSKVLYINTDDPKTLADTRRAVERFYGRYLEN